MAGTRKSHFLSRFYLGGFTASGRKDDPFWVFSRAQQRRWRMRAENAAHKRDLFRLEGPPSRADELEEAYGSVENQIAPVLRRVLVTKVLPKDPAEMSVLLHLPALNAARPPAEINAIAAVSDEVIRKHIVKNLSREFHAGVLERWRAAGRDVGGVSDLENLKGRISEGRIRAVIDKNHLLTFVAARATLLVEMFHNRGWTLLQTTERNGFFICSDRPVYLLNNRNLERRLQPRFDDERFDVIMPLSKELCLIGHSQPVDGHGIASQETLRFVNHLTETSADDFIYSTTQQYPSVGDVAERPELGESYRADLLRSLPR